MKCWKFRISIPILIIYKWKKNSHSNAMKCANNRVKLVEKGEVCQMETASLSTLITAIWAIQKTIQDFKKLIHWPQLPLIMQTQEKIQEFDSKRIKKDKKNKKRP